MPRLSENNIHNCYYLPCASLFLILLISLYTSSWAEDMTSQLASIESTTGHRILYQTAKNLISKPIKNLKLL